VGAQFSIDALKSLGNAAPAGTVAWSRAPFFAINTPQVKQFVTAYKVRYHDVPSDWSLLAYTAVQAWAAGAQKAGSFDGDKVADALAGAKVSTIRGDMTFRACDHMAAVPEYVGQISSNLDPTYGIHTFDDLAVTDPAKIMMPCDKVTSLQHG
jgi:branched-chain amino acid transport system substrate-binding protein